MRLLVKIFHHCVTGYYSGDIEEIGIGGFEDLDDGGVGGEGRGEEFIVDL